MDGKKWNQGWMAMEGWNQQMLTRTMGWDKYKGKTKETKGTREDGLGVRRGKRTDKKQKN